MFERAGRELLISNESHTIKAGTCAESDSEQHWCIFELIPVIKQATGCTRRGWSGTS